MHKDNFSGEKMCEQKRKSNFERHPQLGYNVLFMHFSSKWGLLANRHDCITHYK